MKSRRSACARLWVACVLLVLLCGLGACGSARVSDGESTKLFREGEYDKAAAKLKEGLDKQGPDGRDRLLYLFDLGLALHYAGKYEESIKVFLEAEDVADIKDYTSLSKEAATLLVTDNIKDYKGEDFEKVLVNVFLALDYALSGQYQDALVEARKVNQKLYMMDSEGERKYKQNAFARYLSAILYESQGEFNDAYVDYKNTRDLDPDFPGLGKDLWLMANKLHISDQAAEWKKKYDLSDDDLKAAKERTGKKSKKAEIIVIYQNGISPIKVPSEVLASIPEFKARPNPVKNAKVEIDGVDDGETAVLDNIEETAIENLKEKYAAIIAKKIAGAATKLVVANQIAQRTNNAALGALARLALFAADQADLRSWNLLPKDLQLLRVTVDPGPHTVKVTPIGNAKPVEKTVSVRAGEKILVNFRYMP